MTEIAANPTATKVSAASGHSVDRAVRDRYSAAARQAEAALCCPVSYDEQYLRVIPPEILERDYGCGDPSRHIVAGETVLDLGSGGGKICFICAQVVGAEGRVIGVDCNDEMLGLARRHQPTVAERLGYDNVEFRKGRIQDLCLNLELLEQQLAVHPISTSSQWLVAHEEAERLRQERPLIADESIDVVVSNCVLNLVHAADRRALFAELHRVLRRGGRAVISDIVCDEDVPEHLRRDGQLWSGCLSGAFREDRFLGAFADAGFYGIEIIERQREPWAVIEGIEFRSLTVRAWKGKEGPCLDRHQAVIYRGPWKAVIDDDGHTLRRGERMAVCDKTFRIYTTGPYGEQILGIPPRTDVPLEQASEFDCRRDVIRSPADTKRGSGTLTVLPGEDCCAGSDCC